MLPGIEPLASLPTRDWLFSVPGSWWKLLDEERSTATDRWPTQVHSGRRLAGEEVPRLAERPTSLAGDRVATRRTWRRPVAGKRALDDSMLESTLAEIAGHISQLWNAAVSDARARYEPR